MDDEMRALAKNQTWDLVELPRDKKTVGFERYKVKLIAKGYTQVYEIDYHETFSLVAKMNTIRIILSFVAIFSWNIQQYDVKNDFLHGDLTDEVYI
ncbi:unnamed protein product [Spirodela intermedia]|uniref:Reverse transcriptase Ty1/copia-type domain-containing protein n=1 Tax=Spirodela intermedia TaxID=51605 RepID=A0A7I8KJR2_SPIIN|nr:unnamed protein product [Spirodela intermedia]